MKAPQNLVILLLNLVFITLSAQKKELRKGLNEYKDLAYVKTSEILLDVANKGYKSTNLFEKLGNSFYYNNRMEQAAKWYGELIDHDSITEPENYFRYSQALKGTGNYNKADAFMLRFHEAKPDDSRGRAFVSNSDYLAKIEKASRNLQIQNLSINSEVSDFGSTLHNGELIFASSRDEGEIFEWTEQPFLELFKAENLGAGYGNVQRLDGQVNTKYHESSVAFTPDDNWMFFTRSNYYKKNLATDRKRINRLKLFRLGLAEGQNKGKLKPVRINSNSYSVANPSINKSGDKLYFASDMPGTYGSSDLFVSELKENGSLGKPVNLGEEINTEGRETFPFINQKGDLFFSSDRYTGLGGLDLYVIRDFETKKTENLPIEVENLGKPINSKHDDFAYYEKEESGEGFFSSNRPGGKGDDDIYRFHYKKPCSLVLNGLVKDKKTAELLGGATVTLMDKEGNVIEQKMADDKGFYFFEEIPCDEEYLIRAEKEFYQGNENRFQIVDASEEINQDISLEKDRIEIKKGDNLIGLLDINPIFFDFDKSFIRADAEIELQKIIALLKKHPNMKIDIRSHTDSRGRKSYNKWLSERRFQASVKYIVEKGDIDASRLSGKGYGESQLSNACSDGVKCSEENHQANRRSDFIVVSL